MKPILIYIFLSLSLFSIWPQDQKTTTWYYDQSQAAIKNENFEYAVKILQEGKKKFPADIKLVKVLADLYYDKDFYKLALSEYLKAETIKADDIDNLNQVQRCYGFLNQESDSIKYLKKILLLLPPDEPDKNSTYVEDLAWMYYKTYQFEAGEKLILDFMAKHKELESKRSLYMTLGTIYSGVYDYEKSKEYYLKSIDEAVFDSDNYFASIAYYNLSLLEASFYNYYSALEYTDQSITQYDKSTGHQARAELFQSQLNYERALEEYTTSLKLDKTPLSKIGIVKLYTRFGMPETALQYLDNVFGSKDDSWMLYYGTNTLLHKKEMHETYKDIFDGLYQKERLLPRANLFETIKSGFTAIWYSLNSYYHEQTAKSLSIKIGKSYLKEKNLLDAYIEFYKVNTSYKSIALKYLEKSKAYEMKIAPHCEAFYIQEAGKIIKSPQKLRSSLDMFDLFWEKEAAYESLVNLIPLVKKNSEQQRGILNRVYQYNPGGIFSSGYGLPLVLDITTSLKDRDIKDKITSYLKKAGCQIEYGSDKNTLIKKGFQYRISIIWSSTGPSKFVLTDQIDNTIIKSGGIDPGNGSKKIKAVSFVKQLLTEHIYSF